MAREPERPPRPAIGRRSAEGGPDSGPAFESETELDPDAVFELPISDSLDLHAFRPRDVPDLVREWLDVVHAAGFRRVRLIHGKGIGVQRELVRSLLARDPRVVAFGDLPAQQGGWGATWVELRPD